MFLAKSEQFIVFPKKSKKISNYPRFKGKDDFTIITFKYGFSRVCTVWQDIPIGDVNYKSK